MLQESFLRVYEKLKSEFCRQVFALVRERRGSLSAMEAFSLEVHGEPVRRVFEHLTVERDV